MPSKRSGRTQSTVAPILVMILGMFAIVFFIAFNLPPFVGLR
jgi:hypothetical protein